MHLPVTLLLTLALIGARQEAEDTSKAEPDGPYCWASEDGRFSMRSVVRSGTGLACRVEVLFWGLLPPSVDIPIPGRDEPLKVTLRPIGAPPEWSFKAQEKILALSDIEGNLEALVELLRAGGVIDPDLKWTFGKGHVVYVGDLFDRGLQVNECLWLLYELEARAAAAGGALHFVLGNHEVMNLTGDFRYVRKKYRLNAAMMGKSLDELYSKSSWIGRWLRSKNVAVRIGDDIFVHGGISPAVAESKASLEEINEAVRKGLLADEWVKPRQGPLWLAVDGKIGLTWYRGYFKEPIDEKAMDPVLETYKAKRVVVGHTVVPEIGFALGGRVLAIDVHHAKGVRQAALFEKGDWHRVHADGRRDKLESK